MKKVYSMIGFAQKAGKLSSGASASRTSLLRRKAYLLIMSNDISDNSKELLVKSCEKKNVPWIVVGSKYELGTCVGKAYRVAVTINDPGMARTITDSISKKEKRYTGVVEWQK